MAKKKKKSFTLVEILIVVTILGILAAVIMPSIKDYMQQAKESAAKDNLRILRNAIELYATQHNNVPPGYPGDNPNIAPLEVAFYLSLLNGKYISARPANPFNDLKTVNMIGNAASFPDAPTGGYGWIYQPRTKTIKLDWPGIDSAGAAYFDY